MRFFEFALRFILLMTFPIIWLQRRLAFDIEDEKDDDEERRFEVIIDTKSWVFESYEDMRAWIQTHEDHEHT